MGRLISIASLLTASFSFLSGGDRNNNVMALTSSNFHQVIRRNPQVLVKFYTPWCPHCQAFAPDYIKIANILQTQKPSVIVAEVDCSVETELANQNNIEGYPTIKFYKKGRVATFGGPRTVDNIVQWVIQNS